MASTLTIAIAGTNYTIRDQSLKVIGKADQATVASFQIEDPAASGLFQKGQPCTITDSVQGVLFVGCIDKPSAVNLFPNTYRQWKTNLLDNTYLVMKRTSDAIYNNQYAGVIVVDQIQTILSAEGIWCAASLDYNHLLTDWTTGSPSLTNVVAATNTGDGNVGDGDLELASAGVPLSFVDSFPSGTLSNTQVVNGALQLASSQGLQLQGTAVQSSPNPYVYYKIWSGPPSLIAFGDTLVYDVWTASTCPIQSAGVDGVCTDGTSLRDFKVAGVPLVDQNGIALHPSNDLSGFATDQWYTRVFDLTPLAGKTLAYISVALEGDSNGTYTAYFRHIKQNDTNGVFKTGIFGTTLQNNTVISCNSYANTSLTRCTVFEMSGTRTAPPIALSGVNIPQTSLIDWVAPAIASTLTPGVVSTNTTLPTVTIQTSIDNGATYQQCTNYSAIPSLIAGMSVSGRTLLIQQVFAMAGTDPTLTPTLTGLTLSIQPSYSATKSDVIQTEKTQADWNGGTLTHLSAPSNNALTLKQAARDWAKTSNLSDQTLFGVGGGNAGQDVQAGKLEVFCNGSNDDSRSRQDYAGSAWNNFAATVDINLGNPVVALAYGLEYRTTTWSNNLNSFGWYAYFIFTSGGGAGTLNLAYGTNTSGGGVLTIVATQAITLTSGAVHRMKLLVSGSSHKLYMDDVLYLNVTDSTYSGASGYVACHFFNNSGSAHSGDFSNFGICESLTGTWQGPTQSLSAASIYGTSLIQWQTAPDSTGTTVVAVQTSIDGGSTYQACVNGGQIPHLVAGQSLTGISLVVQALFTSPSPNLTPILQGLTAWVIGQFNATGIWQNTPLGSDTLTRANVVGSLGTATDGQAYTKVGTGTVALTSNEGIISATTGDVEMVLGSNVAADEDGSVRFSLSSTAMQFGIELRRVDGNTFYRLSTTTSTLTLAQKSTGTLAALTTASVSLSVSTYYRMRFRIVGNGPVALYGRVWLDGTVEPATWSVNYVQ